MDLFKKRTPPPPPPPPEEEEKKELKELRESLQEEEVRELAMRLRKAYEYLLRARRELAVAQEELEDSRIVNLERKVQGQPEIDLKPLETKVAELRKKCEEAEQLVRLLERKAKQTDPQFFDFL
jgi:uncharacterized coiled-coil protein SlyX